MLTKSMVVESIINEFCSHYGLTSSDLRKKRESGKGLISIVNGVRVHELRFALARFFYLHSSYNANKIYGIIGWNQAGSVWQAIAVSKYLLDINDLRFTSIYRQLISTVNKWYVDNIQPEKSIETV